MEIRRVREQGTSTVAGTDPTARIRRCLGASLTFLLIAGTLGQQAQANCPSAPVQQGITSSFESCGPNAVAFFWGHGRGVQRIIASESTGASQTAAGHDSGRLQTLADSIMIEGPNGAAGGSYLGDTDGANTGSDGCFLNATLRDSTGTSCSGGSDFGALDYVIAGIDPAQPNVARMAAVSVDFNQFFQFHLLDNAGAPAVDGNPCGGDAFSGFPGPVSCMPIPAPVTLSWDLPPSGLVVHLRLRDVSAIPILDDCAIAESRAVNCPRNLYAGRALMVKHGSCNPQSFLPGLDRRVYVYPAVLPAAGTQAIVPNWLAYSREDLNLNGILDAGEDGSDGSTPNGGLDPLIIPGSSTTDISVQVPAVPGAADCIYFGMTLALDANHFFVNPPTNTIVGETVYGPVVSVLPSAFVAGTASAVSDEVISLSASRHSGKLTVAWETGVENETAGFNVIGVRQGGGAEIRLNASAIPAQQGTTGRGGRYELTFDASRLRGSSQVSVELLKLDGSRRRFGPVSF